MPFFDDFAAAVADYPSNSVGLGFVNVAVQTGTAGAVNVGEVWRFQVSVSNHGHLNMTNVALLIDGENGARVSTSAAGPWSPFITVGSLSVNAHAHQTTDTLYFRAPGVAVAAGTPLLRVLIRNFDANLDHLLMGHSGSSISPVGTYASQVFP